MKKLISIILLSSLSALLKKVFLFVPGMVCQMCVQGMQRGFSDVVESPEDDIIVDLSRKIHLKLKKEITEEFIKQTVKDADTMFQRLIAEIMKKIISFFSFWILSTLLCCALPATLVSLGMAQHASMTSTFSNHMANRKKGRAICYHSNSPFNFILLYQKS